MPFYCWDRRVNKVYFRQYVWKERQHRWRRKIWIREEWVEFHNAWAKQLYGLGKLHKNVFWNGSSVWKSSAAENRQIVSSCLILLLFTSVCLLGSIKIVSLYCHHFLIPGRINYKPLISACDLDKYIPKYFLGKKKKMLSRDTLV